MEMKAYQLTRAKEKKNNIEFCLKVERVCQGLTDHRIAETNEIQSSCTLSTMGAMNFFSIRLLNNCVLILPLV
jgi:hypothetical protein